MKICAIVSEYNPIHTGHMYHIEQSRTHSGCDAVLALMSGNIVQRGDLAICDKATRARCAVAAGIDIVVELPTVFAVGNAETFALGAVTMLNKINDVTHLSFGSEIGEIGLLKQAVEVLDNETAEFKEILQRELEAGNSFPKARETAFDTLNPDLKGILSGANNILALEYLRALKKTDSKIVPITVKRLGSDYHKINIEEEHPSSTAVRRLIETGRIDSYAFAPQEIVDLIKRSIVPLTRSYSGLSALIIKRLNDFDTASLLSIADASEAIVSRIVHHSKQISDFSLLINEVKAKNFTMARIKRFIMCALLGITQEDVTNFLQDPNYFNTLAVRESAKEFLSTPDINITARFSDFEGLPSACKRAAEIDEQAASVYSAATGLHRPHYTHRLFVKE